MAVTHHFITFIRVSREISQTINYFHLLLVAIVAVFIELIINKHKKKIWTKHQLVSAMDDSE